MCMTLLPSSGCTTGFRSCPQSWVLRTGVKPFHFIPGDHHRFLGGGAEPPPAVVVWDELDYLTDAVDVFRGALPPCFIGGVFVKPFFGCGSRHFL